MGSRHLLEVVVGLLDSLVLVLVAIVNHMMYLSEDWLLCRQCELLSMTRDMVL
jgi:hypothetical protein